MSRFLLVDEESEIYFMQQQLSLFLNLIILHLIIKNFICKIP